MSAALRARRGSRGASAALAAGMLAGVLVGCGEAADGTATPSAWPNTVTEEYLPGLAADVHLPQATGDGSVPVVLLVPGGGWRTAERAGLSPLAAALAEAGMVAVNATYSAGMDGAVFPEPAQDVTCAARFAVARTRAEGLPAGPLVILGHSAGAHLAALAATSDGDFADGCPHPDVAIDGLVGLAGVYDTASFEFALVELFGSARADDPMAWAAGDPIARIAAARAPGGLRVLLRHGDADDTVPLAQSQAFEAALRAAGVPVALEVLPGVDHARVYDAGVTAAPVIEWISEQWPAGSRPSS